MSYPPTPIAMEEFHCYPLFSGHDFNYDQHIQSHFTNEFPLSNFIDKNDKIGLYWIYFQNQLNQLTDIIPWSSNLKNWTKTMSNVNHNIAKDLNLICVPESHKIIDFIFRDKTENYKIEFAIEHENQNWDNIYDSEFPKLLHSNANNKILFYYNEEQDQFRSPHPNYYELHQEINTLCKEFTDTEQIPSNLLIIRGTQINNKHLMKFEGFSTSTDSNKIFNLPTLFLKYNKKIDSYNPAIPEFIVTMMKRDELYDKVL